MVVMKCSSQMRRTASDHRAGAAPAAALAVLRMCERVHASATAPVLSTQRVGERDLRPMLRAWCAHVFARFTRRGLSLSMRQCFTDPLWGTKLDFAGVFGFRPATWVG